MGETKKYTKLNLLKGIACIAVVFIHVSFPGLFGEITATASGFAVPVFFMISGYFAFGCSSHIIKRRLFKTIRIFLLAYAMFFLYGAGKALMNNITLTEWLSVNFSWKTPVEYLVFCNIDFAMPLWYLIALIETYLLWLIIVKYGKEKASLKLIPILFVLLILSTMFSLSWRVNFLTQGMSWFLLGYLFNTDAASKISRISLGTLILSAVIGCAVAIMPVIIRSSVKFGMIGIIPYASSLFALALKDPYISTCKHLEFVGEKLSLYIYLIHVPIRGAIILLSSRVLKGNIYSDLFLWVKPLMVLILTILIAWILNAFSIRFKQGNNKPSFKQ